MLRKIEEMPGVSKNVSTFGMFHSQAEQKKSMVR